MLASPLSAFFITSTKEVMFLSALVCSLEGLCKTTRPMFTEFGGRCHMDLSETFRFCGNSDRVKVTAMVRRGTTMICLGGFLLFVQ